MDIQFDRTADILVLDRTADTLELVHIADIGRQAELFEEGLADKAWIRDCNCHAEGNAIDPENSMAARHHYNIARSAAEH